MKNEGMYIQGQINIVIRIIILIIVQGIQIVNLCTYYLVLDANTSGTSTPLDPEQFITIFLCEYYLNMIFEIKNKRGFHRIIIRTIIKLVLDYSTFKLQALK